MLRCTSFWYSHVIEPNNYTLVYMIFQGSHLMRGAKLTDYLVFLENRSDICPITQLTDTFIQCQLSGYNHPPVNTYIAIQVCVHGADVILLQLHHTSTDICSYYSKLCNYLVIYMSLLSTQFPGYTWRYLIYSFLLQVQVGNLLFEPGYIRINERTTLPPPPQAAQTTRQPSTEAPTDSMPLPHTSNNKDTNSQSLMLGGILVAGVFTVAVLVIVCLLFRWRRKHLLKDAQDDGALSKQQTPSCFGGSDVTGWQRMDYAQSCGSVSSMTSVGSTLKLPPLPVTAIFGPDRRTTGRYQNK